MGNTNRYNYGLSYNRIKTVLTRKYIYTYSVMQGVVRSRVVLSSPLLPQQIVDIFDPILTWEDKVTTNPIQKEFWDPLAKTLIC